jgi:hypothetical protein
MVRAVLRRSSNSDIELCREDDDFLLRFPSECDPATQEVDSREIPISMLEAESINALGDGDFARAARELLREHDAQEVTRR